MHKMQQTSVKGEGALSWIRELALVSDSDGSVWIVVSFKWWDLATMLWWALCPFNVKKTVKMFAEGKMLTVRMVRVANGHATIHFIPRWFGE